MLAILRGADLTFGNFEGTALDLRHFGGSPQAEAGGAWLLAAPAVAADLRSMGFDLVSRANNHTTDWGVEGMRSTDEILDAAGIVHAGTGPSLSAARAPGYLDVPLGRVALLSMASSFTPMSRAADGLGEVPPRAGVNALRTAVSVVLSRERLAVLRQIRDAPSTPRGAIAPSPDTSSTEVTLFGAHYRASDRIGDGVALEFEMDSSDEQGILRSIRQARATSDIVIATIHAHEPGNGSEQPANFLPPLAHAAIDAGADAFVGHGPHQLRGIEIYKGRPIFYSLGNFFFQEILQQPLTPDAWAQMRVDPHAPNAMTEAEFDERRRLRYFREDIWYQSVIAVSRYRAGRVAEIRLYPVELGHDGPDAWRGVPGMAQPEMARTILERLRRLSQPLGTTIAIEGDVGVVRVP